MKGKQFAKTALFIIITLVIFYFLIKKVSISALVRVFSNANWLYVAAGILITASFPAVMAERWRIIIKTMGYDVSFKKCFSVIMGVWPLNTFTPSKAGDIAKAYFIRDKVPASKVIGSVLTERLLDLLMLALFCLIGLVMLKDYRYILIPVLIFLGVLAMFILVRLRINLPIRDSWKEKLENILLSMKVFTKEWKNLLFILFWTFMNWFTSALQTLLFFLALGADVNLATVFAYMPLAIFVGLIPLTLGGMGTRDSAFIFLFSKFATASQSLGVGLLYSFTGYWILSIIGIPFMKKEFR